MAEPVAHSALQQDEQALRELVGGMVDGQETALSALYDATVARVNGLALALLGNPEDAQEVVCDVYVQAWNGASRYDDTRGNVLAWLMTICRSRSLDALRRREVRTRTHEQERRQTEAESAPPPEALLALVEQGSAVHDALAGLSDQRRQLLALSFYRGLTHQEIAQTVGLPLGTVKSHLRRALLALRDCLEH